MFSLPLSKLWGAEKRPRNDSAGSASCVAQLVALGEAQLASLFGDAGGRFLYAAVRAGIRAYWEPKTRAILERRNDLQKIDHRDTIIEVFMGLAEEISYRLWSSDFKSRTLVLKLRYDDFSTISRDRTGSLP